MTNPKSFYIIRALFIAILFSPLIFSSCSKEPVQPQSPDGRISVSLGTYEDQAFSYSVLLDGEILARPSSIMLEAFRRTWKRKEDS